MGRTTTGFLSRKGWAAEMGETRRYVSVEIVYDGDECDPGCPFLSVDFRPECQRFRQDCDRRDRDHYVRCDGCKAEDARVFTVVPKDGTPEYKITITPDIAQKIIREVKESKGG